MNTSKISRVKISFAVGKYIISTGYGQRQNYRKKKVGKKGRAPTAACFSIINYSCKKWGEKKTTFATFPTA